MNKRTIFAALLASLFVSTILLVYTPSRHEPRAGEQIPWIQECSELVEYPIPNDLPHRGWKKTKWGEVHPEENITIVNILKLKGKWDFNLTGCAYENGVLFLKFNSKMMSKHTSTFETTTAPLIYASILQVIPKVKAERLVAYIDGDINKRITIQLGASGNTLMRRCLHPGYGEINVHSVELSENELSLNEGEQIVLRGTISGKEYHVREVGGSEVTCYYDGHVVLKAYLGPGASKDSWSYMQGKLTSIEGLAVKITPHEFLLRPNETIDFRVEINLQKTGTYYLYIVALGDKGWKSWDVVEINGKA